LLSLDDLRDRIWESYNRAAASLAPRGRFCFELSSQGRRVGCRVVQRRINRLGPCGRLALGQRWWIDWPGRRSRRQVRLRRWVGYWVMHRRIDRSRRRSWRVRLRRRLRGIGMRYGRVGIHDRTEWCVRYSPLRTSRQLKNGSHEAVRRAVAEPWSRGPAEEQVNWLKTLKRSMYGRAGIELLRALMMPLAKMGTQSESDPSKVRN
jgi:hypothetical protein